VKIVLILLSFCFTLFALTLEEAEEKARNENRDILIQKSIKKALNSTLEATKAKNYGSVDLHSSYTKYDSARTLKPLAPPISPSVATSTDISNIGVSYSVVLFNGFSDTKEISISKIQNEIQNNFLRLTLNQIVYNVQAIYLDILSLQKQKDAKEELKEALNILKENIAQELKVGKRAKIELLKVDATLQDIVTQINTLSSNIDILKSSLAILINYEDDLKELKLEDIKESKKEILKNRLLDNKHYFDKIENLSTYKISFLNYQKTANEYQKAKSSYYPKITANTQYSKVYSNEGDEDKIWQAGVTLNWNIFDFGKTSLLVQKAKIAQQQASLELQKRRLEIKQNITEAINKIKQNSDLYLGSSKEFLFTSESEKIEKIRYEQEAIDIYTYLYAKSSNAIVKSKKILAKYNLLKSYFYLDYILKESK